MKETTTPEAAERQKAQIVDLQRFAIDELIDDEDSNVFEKDRGTQFIPHNAFSELGLLKTFFQVCNDARCHFLFEIVGPSEQRYLSSEWIRLKATVGGPTFEALRLFYICQAVFNFFKRSWKFTVKGGRITLLLCSSKMKGGIVVYRLLNSLPNSPQRCGLMYTVCD